MQDEFIITNRLGSYSSSTFHSGNTRKYHGVLISSNSKLERKVIVNRLEETIEVNGNTFSLNTNIYKNNTISPTGFEYISDFNIDPEVSIEFQVNDVNIKKIIAISDSLNRVEISYIINSNSNSVFRINPLLTFRSINVLRRFSVSDEFKVTENLDSITVDLENNHKLIISGNYSNFINNNYKYYDFEYPIEKQRGYDYTEDLISVGEFKFDIKAGYKVITLNFELDNKENYEIDSSQIERVPKKISASPLFDPVIGPHLDPDLLEFRNFLEKRGESFIIQNSYKTSIIAGYHWFDDWGRDTFISFRGLLLCKNKFKTARNILFDWTKYIKNGLIPNRPGLNEYNSLDATLWYIISIYYYWQHTSDLQTVKNLLPQVSNILQELIAGTKYGIHLEASGLLSSTNDTFALTWMDAIVDGIPVTPRTNAAVEIQMLWYNVLNCYKEMESLVNNVGDNYYINLIIKNLKKTFNKVYWLNKWGYVADHLKGDQINIQLRPNPVIGFSLPFNMLSEDKSKRALRMISSLLTPIGLKTLHGKHPKYVAEYVGDQKQRDLAYHNGTVWPWLLGFYLKSYLNIYGINSESKSYVEGILLDFWTELKGQKLNYIPEVFSGDSLKPNGCLTQAWNYATLSEVFYDLEER